MGSDNAPSSGAAGSGSAAEAPLLPEHAVSPSAPGGGSASVLGAVFNVSTSVVGAGIMSIPAAMRVLGVAPAVVLIMGVAVLANAAVDFMLRYTRGAPSYAGIMGDAFGRAGAALLNVFVAFNAFGTLTIYLIIIGDVVSGAANGGDAHAGVLPEWFGRYWWTSREVVLVAAAVILLPLVLQRRVVDKLEENPVADLEDSKEVENTMPNQSGARTRRGVGQDGEFGIETRGDCLLMRGDQKKWAISKGQHGKSFQTDTDNVDQSGEKSNGSKRKREVLKEPGSGSIQKLQNGKPLQEDQVLNGKPLQEDQALKKEEAGKRQCAF